MRIGVYGGSFDPPHRAHSAAVLWALETGEVDCVVMAPSARHPFGKEAAAPFEDRLAMCRLAARPFGPERVEVTDIEARRDGPSYTVDTLRQLAAERPGASLRLVVGSDVAAELDGWRAAEEVRRLAPLLEVPRSGGADGLWLGALPDLSSSMVRARIAAGEPVDRLVAGPVLDYIRERRLYSSR